MKLIQMFLHILRQFTWIYIISSFKVNSAIGAICHPKYAVIQDHTACLDASSEATSTGISEADKSSILKAHNDYRALAPNATKMLKMYWDDEVAFIAKRWAENCVLNHDQSSKRLIPGRFFLGQNLAYSSAHLTWAAVIKLWNDEYVNFTYNGNNVFEAVGHYTQIVSDKSQLLGCAYAQCGKYHYYVCNYGPAGNTQFNQPYEYGHSGDSCPQVYTNGLCDCNGKACEGLGNLEMSTCDCVCSKDTIHFTGPLCTLNCSISDQDHAVCGTIMNDCNVIPTMYMCPWMCKVCPYADQVVDINDEGNPGGNGSGAIVDISHFLYVIVVLGLACC